ncbi:MAG: SWIM zinc finger family protein [Acidimicrobiales bacterium]
MTGKRGEIAASPAPAGRPLPPRLPKVTRPVARRPRARQGFGQTWWGRAWVEAIEGRARLDPNRLPRGRTYARRGSVGELGVEPGVVRAAVQGSRAKPYAVWVRVRPFDDGEWDRLLDSVASRLGHAAALLDGELPAELSEDVAAAGLDLLPGLGEVQPRCTCPDWADPCKHSAAVCYLIADALDADPFLLLLLRGRSREEVMAAVRRRRGAALGAPAGEPDEGEEDPGLRAGEVAARGERPGLPAPPLPPASPGRPVVLSADPPPLSGLHAEDLRALAADAAERAWALAVGDRTTGLELSLEEDLARRAAAALGEGGRGVARGPGVGDMARRAGLQFRQLNREALGWRDGGRAGRDTLVGSWRPERPDLEPGRRALGPGTSARNNRVTLGRRQLRLGRDGRWYPYVRAGDGGWDPAGAPAADPEELGGQNWE